MASAAFLLQILRKLAAKLPETWKHSKPIRNFRLGVVFLLVYLAIIFTGEWIALSLASHGIYNSYVMSLNLSLSTPFLFGFFYLHTSSTWKRYTYFLLYFIPLGYFISGGYFHPRAILGEQTIQFVYIPIFLAAFFFLTNLLLHPKSAYFRFQLKICLSVLINSVITLIVTSFHWNDVQLLSKVIYYIHMGNMTLYYFSLALIFVTEAFKLRRTGNITQ